MFLKLPFAITDLLPLPTGRSCTAMEALVDFLITGYERTVSIDELRRRWHWSIEEVERFVTEHSHFFKEDIYEEEDTATLRRQRAQAVLDIYNEVCDRECQLNESRIRTINARITEGKKLKPKIGPAQFRAVFEYKKKEWEGTEQEKFLTLETLCRPTHFLNYLEQARLDYVKKLAQKKTEDEGVTLSGTLFKTANG